MSTHSYYQALPEQSRLFQRLRTDRALHTLYADLTLLGGGPLHLSDLDPSEIDETLDYLTEDRAAFKSRAEAERTLSELRQELKQACTSFPGIEDRAAYFEQVHRELETLLPRELSRVGYDLAEPLVQVLLYGDDLLAPALGDYRNSPLRLNAAPVVQEGARALFALKPEVLDRAIEDVDFPAEDYERRRSVYQEAARRGEVVIVLTS